MNYWRTRCLWVVSTNDMDREIILALLGVIEVLLALILRWLWTRQTEIKQELSDEILRLRKRLHDIEPMQHTLDNFAKFIRDRN